MAASMIKHFSKGFLIRAPPGDHKPMASKGARVLAGQVWRSAPRVKDAGETSLVHKFSTLNLETVDRGSTVMRQGVCGASTQRSLLEVCQPFKTTIRTKIRYSKLNKDKTARPVVRRFYRLDWGAWIRTRCGRGKKRFQKSAERKRRLDQHVFCNKQQNKLLDQLVTPFWRRKMFFVDDPYAPYQKRHHIPKYYKEKPVFLP